MFRVLKKWLTDTKKETGVDAELCGDPLLQDGELYFDVKLAGLTQLQRYSAKEIRLFSISCGSDSEHSVAL